MDFSPYSKEYQLRGHQKEKEKPNFKQQRHKKKPKRPKVNKNIEYFHGRKIPHRKQRGAVTTKAANEALRRYGEYCYRCGSPNYQLHHVRHKGFSIGGRGVWRNLIPLCVHCHLGKGGVHDNAEFDQQLQQMHEEKYGPRYFQDMWDLWMDGLIESPTEELYERYMEEEEVKAGGN